MQDQRLELKLKYERELKGEYTEPLEEAGEDTLKGLLEQYNQLYTKSQSGNYSPAQLAILDQKDSNKRNRSGYMEYISIRTAISHILILTGREGYRMATKFEFYLSEQDTDRLFYSKEEAGEDELTMNEYAKQLLHSALYKLCPRVPETDEDGNYIKGATK